MITSMVGDITKVNASYICNAANGIGPMGAGVAGAIRRAGGKVIQQEAFSQCKAYNPKPGDIYTTNAGALPYNKIIHLVTMKNPGGGTSYTIVRKCLENLIRFCERNAIGNVALPALGTGIGNLDIAKVAAIYKELLEPMKEVEFLVVDIDERFINEFK